MRLVLPKYTPLIARAIRLANMSQLTEPENMIEVDMDANRNT